MKLKFNTKSNTIAAYCIIVFAACLFLVALVFKYNTFLFYFHKVAKVLSPIIWGMAIAYLLNPFVVFFERHLKKLLCKKKEHPSLTRILSIAISAVLVLGIITAIVIAIISEIDTLKTFFSSLPSYLNNLKNYLTEKISNILENNPEINDFFTNEFDNAQQLILDSVNKLEPMLDDIFAKDGVIANLTDSAWSFIIGLKDCLLGIIASIYLLYSKETFIAQAKKIVYALFSEKKRDTILRIASKTNYTFLHFITGKAVDSFIIGVITFFGMNFMNLNSYAVLISVIIGITNMIPFFGPIIGAIPSGLLILLTSPEKTLIFIIFILVLQQFDGNILGPKILGNSLGLSPFWIMFSIFLGGGLFGFAGMITFVPLFAVFYSIVKDIVNSKLKRKDLPVSTAYYRVDNSEPILKPSGKIFNFNKLKKLKKPRKELNSNTNNTDEIVEKASKKEDSK